MNLSLGPQKLPRRFRPRVIPILLLSVRGLVKTVGFSKPTYIGDPINAVKIFNDSEVDELIVIDISNQRQEPDFEKIQELTTECFMPLCYGGGVTSFSQVQKLVASGIEKVSFNQSLADNPKLINETARTFGVSSVVASIDVKKSFFGGYQVHTQNGKKNLGKNPVEWARYAEDQGAGEILLTSVDREGSQKGYDLDLISQVAQAVKIPVVAHGGAGQLADLKKGISAGASAVAAGSLFVYHGRLKGILINYPSQKDLRQMFEKGPA